MRQFAIRWCVAACFCWPAIAHAGRGARPAGASGPPVQVDNSLRTPAFQPQGPDFFISAEDHGLIGAKNRNAYFSFSRFDVPAGSSATFASGTPVRNVLARVTGGGTTTIDGSLRVSIPDANLFLVNPNGIVVGKNASFDLSGSLVVTTADEVRFKDATFSARGGGNGPAAMLSTANPSAFGFLSRAPAKITVNGLAALGAPVATPGKSVSLVGGNIAIDQSTLSAAAGRINLVSVASAGEVRLDAGLKSTLAVDNPTLGDVALSGQSTLELGDGGNLLVRAHDFTMTESTISARSQQTPGKKDIRLDLSGRLSLSGGSKIDADTLGTADGARITIDADAVSITENSRIKADVGTANNDGTDPSLSSQNALVTGRGGNIRVRANSLVIDDLGFISSFSFGAGRAADIDLVVAGRASLHGPAADPSVPEKKQALFTGVIIKTDDQAGAGPSGGVITVRADELEIRRGATLSSTTKTGRNAGAVVLNARRIVVDGTGRQSLTGVEARTGEADAATGHGGDILVTGPGGRGTAVDSLTLVEGGTFSAATFGQGDGGNVVVHADRVRIQGPGAGFTGLFARSTAVEPRVGVPGDGGNVSVFATALTIVDGDVRRGAISASSQGATADAGSVTIRARELTLDHGAIGAAAKRGSSAGDITVTSARVVTLKNGSALTTEALAANGGNILIEASERVVVDHSTLTAASPAGSGKTLTIDPPIVALNKAVINGQDLNRTLQVTIDAKSFLQSTDTQILTNLPPNLPPDIDISGQLVPLTIPDLGISARLIDLCPIGLRSDMGTSSFLITGRGGTPVQPGGLVPALGVGSPTRQP